MGATTPSVAAWREVLALFDRWAEAGAEEREAGLQRVRAEQPALYPRLMAMIEADRAAEARRFLAEPAALATQDLVDAGTRLGAWELRELIGSGGMGQVWLATRSDGLYSGRAAIKLLHTASMGAHAQARFAREGELLARLSHPHIAQLLDAGLAADGTRYLVLEYVQGQRIDHWCDARSLGIAARLQLFMQVCDALTYAHAHLVVHRDLKPANILVRDDGHVKLLDFGVAKLLAGGDEAGELTELTRIGPAGLTPEYAAPEQIEGQPITTATDVYALGVVLFVLLSGARPYAGTSRGAAAMARAIVEEPPRSLLAAVRELPAAVASRGATLPALQQALRGDLETIVAKALKKAPQERYATVQELRDDLQRHLAHEPVSAQPDTFGYRARKFAQRNRVQVAALGALIVSLLAGIAATAWQWRVATHEAERTRSVVQVLTKVFTELSPLESGTAKVPVVDVLRRGWAHTKATLGTDPALQAEVAGSLGLMFVSSGDMAAAAEALALKRAHMLANQQTRSRDYLKVTHELAYATSRLGRSAEARRLFEEVVAAGTLLNDPAAEEPVWAQVRLGTLAREQGRLDDAERGLRSAVASAERHFGLQSQTYRFAMTALANVLKERGRWAEARDLHASLYAVYADQRSADAAIARYSLVTLDVELGRYGKAAPALRELIELLVEVWGEGDAFTIYTRLWQAVALYHLGRYSESDQALDLARRAALSSNEPVVRHHVALIEARQTLRRGNIERAEPLLKESLQYFETAGTTLAAEAARSLALLGECWLRRGDTVAAVEGLTRAYEAQRSLFGPRHADMLPTLLIRAVAIDSSRGVAAAGADYQEALAVAEQLLPAGHPDALRAALLAAQADWREHPTDAHRLSLQRSAEAYKSALAERSDVDSVSVYVSKLLVQVPRQQVSVQQLWPLLVY